MKKEKEMCNKSIKDYIDKVTTPIFEEALQEGLPNSMTTTKKTFSYFWRPHNFRRKISIKEKTNSISTRIKGTISKLPMELNINPHTKLISIKKFKPNITIQYGRNTLTAIYCQDIINGEKRGWLIERDTINEINARIDEIKQNIEKKLDNALKSFSRKFDLSIPFKKPTWSRYEDFIKGEEYIDKIPRECIIHDTFFKKVYGKGIEFKKVAQEEPTVHLKNYIKNRAIEDIAPEIANSLNQLCLRFDNMGNRIIDMMNTRREVDTELAINIKTHNKVFEKLDKLLSQKDLRKWL